MQRRFVRTTPISPYEPAHGDILTAGKRPLVAQVGPFAEFPLFGPCTGAKVGEANKRADSIAVPVAFGQLQLLTGRLSVGAHVPGTLQGVPGTTFLVGGNNVTLSRCRYFADS